MTASGTPAAPVRISICTHNGEEWLPHNLAALAPQAARFGIPVDIIDSGSKPESASAIANLARGHGASYVRVDQPGLSVARNAGLARCTEAWIAYLDDDAVAGADYAASLQRAVAMADRDVGAIGGRVVPRWPSRVYDDAQDPSIIPSRWKGLLSILDDERVFDSTSSPLAVGANVAFRVSSLRQVGGFPPHLGRVGANLVSGEERHVLTELVLSGNRTTFDGRICVEHMIQPERLRMSWIRTRAMKEGHVNFTFHTKRRRAVTALKCIAAAPALALLARTDAKNRIAYQLRLFHNRGYLDAALGSLRR